MLKFRSYLRFLSESISQLIQGFIMFLLCFSGLLCALLLRHLDYNGTIIAGIGVLVEIIAMLLCYLIFKSYLKEVEEPEPPTQKGKKK